MESFRNNFHCFEVNIPRKKTDNCYLSISSNINGSNVRNQVCIRGEDIVSLVLFYLFFAVIRISNSQQCMVTGANKGGEGWCRLATLF